MAAPPHALELWTLPGLLPVSSWPPAPSLGPCLHAPHAGPVQVHLLGLPADPEPWVARLEPFASADRRARAARFHFPMDALRCLAAEALLRHALGERHGLGAGQWEVAIGPHGKPFLTGQPGIHFNLSHAGPWVACAVHDAPVGIDVEAAQAMDPLPAASIMAAGELSHFRQLPAQAGQDYFYRLWTLKESLVKALGVGLSLDPRSITLRLEPQPITASHASLALGGLTLRELPLPEGHRAALCY